MQPQYSWDIDIWANAISRDIGIWALENERVLYGPCHSTEENLMRPGRTAQIGGPPPVRDIWRPNHKATGSPIPLHKILSIPSSQNWTPQLTIGHGQSPQPRIHQSCVLRSRRTGHHPRLPRSQHTSGGLATLLDAPTRDIVGGPEIASDAPLAEPAAATTACDCPRRTAVTAQT
jgi:hypothetical protein